MVIIYLEYIYWVIGEIKSKLKTFNWSDKGRKKISMAIAHLETGSVKDTEDLSPISYPKFLKPSHNIMKRMNLVKTLNKIKKLAPKGLKWDIY